MQYYYFNRLPHYTPIAASYFITVRLYDSLPQHIFLTIKKAYKKKLERILNSAYTKEEKTSLINELKDKYFANFISQLTIARGQETFA